MIFACLHRERSRENDYARPLVAKRAEEFWKAHVVANRATYGNATHFVGDDIIASANGVGFTVDESIGRIDIEEMHLPIAGDLLSFGIEYQRRVVVHVSVTLDHASGMQRDLQLAREALDKLVGFTIRESVCARLDIVAPLPEEREVLGQYDQIGIVPRNGLAHQPLCLTKVRRLVVL